MVPLVDMPSDVLEAWKDFAKFGLLPHVDPVRVGLIQSGRPLRHPSPEHDAPGSVKTDDGQHIRYIRPLSQPCEDKGCRVYLWDDERGADIWMQHGDNPEAVRPFPRRLFLEPSFPCSATRPDVFEWIVSCHDHTDPDRRR